MCFAFEGFIFQVVDEKVRAGSGGRYDIIIMEVMNRE